MKAIWTLNQLKEKLKVEKWEWIPWYYEDKKYRYNWFSEKYKYTIENMWVWCYKIIQKISY